MVGLIILILILAICLVRCGLWFLSCSEKFLHWRDEVMGPEDEY
jgi:hypothetical protein